MGATRKTPVQLAHAVSIRAGRYATAVRTGRSLGKVKTELLAAVAKLLSAGDKTA